MITEVYHYTIEEIEGLIIYDFTTLSGVVYKVIFDYNHFRENLPDFPQLLGNGYDFAFYCMSDKLIIDGAAERNKRANDTKISSTITSIICHFFDTQDSSLILLFQCDSSDKKQLFRHALFQRWHRKSSHKAQIHIKTIQVEIQVGKGVTDNRFMGYLYSSANPNLEKVIMEFEDFLGNMINSNVK